MLYYAVKFILIQRILNLFFPPAKENLAILVSENEIMNQVMCSYMELQFCPSFNTDFLQTSATVIV